MTRKSGALLGALVLAVVHSVWSASAGAKDYKVVIVSVDLVTEGFVENALQGSFSGGVTTSNLPGGLLQTSGSYTQLTPDSIGGSWSLSDGGANALGGSFQMPNRFYTSGFAPFSGSITLDPGASSGLYAGAVGGGSFEAFVRQGYDQGSGQFLNQQVTITRLQFTADGPDQTDHRGVAVSSRVGFNDGDTQHGMNIGVPTSDSVAPILTSVRSEYDFSQTPVLGQSFNRNDIGDSQHWSYDVNPASGQDLGAFLFRYYGTATFLDGTGVFAGATASADWESFEIGTGQIGPNVWGVATIAIDRYTLQTVPIPEPQTYLLMLAGLGLVGAVAMRRRIAG